MRLCSSAAGVESGSEVRNTAVPFTRLGGRWLMILTKSRSGGDSRLVLTASTRVPRTQVAIRANMPAPSSTGTNPPSKIRRRLAERNTRSRVISGAATRIARARGQRHSFHMTMKAREVVTAMVPETAMP